MGVTLRGATVFADGNFYYRIGGVWVPYDSVGFAVDPPPAPPPTQSSLAPAWLDAGTVSFTDSPMTITAGGTYEGLRISAPDGVNCVEIDTSDIVIFRDCIFEHSDGDGIFAPGGTVSGYASNPKIEVYDSYFLGRHPTTAGDDIGKAIRSSGGSRLIVENCQTQRGRIYAFQFSADPSAVLRVRYNVGLNIDGRDSAAGGEPTNTITGYRQFFQHNGRTGIQGTFEIAWNEIWNDPEDSAIEDVINLFSTGGTSGNPIRVHHNLINGAYPADPAKTNYAGGGIMLADGPGDQAYGIAEYNVVLASANYGMAIASGSHFTIRNNRVFRTGKWPDGITNGENGDGPGIYVYDYGSTTDFGDHTVRDNVIRWQEGDDPNDTNNKWVVSPGDNFTDTGNVNYDTVIDQAFIDAEVIAYRDGAAAAGVTIGVTGDDSTGTLIGVGSPDNSMVAYPPTGPVTSGDFFVDPVNGNDGDSGTSVGSPFRTIQKALSVLEDGATILVRAGTINLSSRLLRSTAWATGVEVFGYGNERPLLDGSGLGTGANGRILYFNGSSRREHWKGFELINSKEHSVEIEGAHMKIEDFDVHHGLREGIYIANFTGVEEGYNIIMDTDVWRMGDGVPGGSNVTDLFVATASAGQRTRYNKFIRVAGAHGADDCLDLFRSEDGEVLDSVMVYGGYYWNGINSGGDGNGFKLGGDHTGNDNVIKGSLAFGNRRNGIDGNLGDSINYHRNTAVGNGAFGFDLNGDNAAEDGVAQDNIALGNGTQESSGPYVSDTYNTWNLGITNAQFADPSAFDWSLLSGSPAIGAGVTGGNLGASATALARAKAFLAKIAAS